MAVWGAAGWAARRVNPDIHSDCPATTCRITTARISREAIVLEGGLSGQTFDDSTVWDHPDAAGCFGYRCVELRSTHVKPGLPEDRKVPQLSAQGSRGKKGWRGMKFFLVLLGSAALAACAPLSPPEETAKRPALDVPYEPTSYGIAEEMLNLAEVTSQDRVYDLGCGDGRIVILAARQRGARGVGVDLDPERIRESRANAKAAGVDHRVRFFEQNLFDTDIGEATVVMIYLYPEVNLKLRPKLLEDLKPGTRIVSHSHTMGDWKDDATRKVEGHDLHFFVVPANVTGTWRWVDPDGRSVVLSLTQKFQRVKGSLTRGDETHPIVDCSLRGSRILFSVERPAKGNQEVLSYEGEISGNAIIGKITRRGTRHEVNRWQAARDPSTRVSIAE